MGAACAGALAQGAPLETGAVLLDFPDFTGCTGFSIVSFLGAAVFLAGILIMVSIMSPFPLVRQMIR